MPWCKEFYSFPSGIPLQTGYLFDGVFGNRVDQESPIQRFFQDSADPEDSQFFPDYMNDTRRYNERYTIKNDGFPTFAKCERCACWTTAPLCFPEGGGALNADGYPRDILDEPPGSGFFCYGKTVLHAPPGTASSAKRWFYVGPVAYVLKSWRPHSACPARNPPNTQAEPAEQAYKADEPRERTGHVWGTTTGGSAVYSIDEEEEEDNKFILAYMKVNGNPLLNSFGGAGEESPVGPIAAGDTITLEFMVNRSFFDEEQYLHAFSRKRFLYKFFNDKTGEDEYVYKDRESVTERGVWDRAEMEWHYIDLKRGGVDEPLERPTYYRRTVVKQRTDEEMILGDALYGTRGAATHDGIREDLGIPPDQPNVLSVGGFGMVAKCPGVFIPGFDVSGGITQAVTSNVWKNCLVGLSSDWITPIVDKIEQGKITEVRRNPMHAICPCVYPLFVSQEGYYGEMPVTTTRPDGQVHYYTWPPNPLP